MFQVVLKLLGRKRLGIIVPLDQITPDFFQKGNLFFCFCSFCQRADAEIFCHVDRAPHDFPGSTRK